jgi:hypothetical protein
MEDLVRDIKDAVGLFSAASVEYLDPPAHRYTVGAYSQGYVEF